MADRSKTTDIDDAPRTAGGLLHALALSSRKAAVAVIVGVMASLMMLLRPAEIAPWASVLLAMVLAWCTMIDIDRYRLPDLITLPMIAAGLLHCWLTAPQQAPHHLIGAAAGYLSLVLVAELYRHVRKRDGLGRGDAKLLAAAGAWLGWKTLPFVVLGASVAALGFVVCLAIVRGRGALMRPLPFGPFIAGAIWLCWIARPWPLA